MLKTPVGTPVRIKGEHCQDSTYLPNVYTIVAYYLDMCYVIDRGKGGHNGNGDHDTDRHPLYEEARARDALWCVDPDYVLIAENEEE